VSQLRVVALFIASTSPVAKAKIGKIVWANLDLDEGRDASMGRAALEILCRTLCHNPT
jgi:hypothetical protein